MCSRLQLLDAKMADSELSSLVAALSLWGESKQIAEFLLKRAECLGNHQQKRVSILGNFVVSVILYLYS